jgi:integrase
VRQKKSRQPVKFELTEHTRQAVDDYLRIASKKPGEFLFAGRRGPGRSVQLLLGHTKIESTVRYLGIEVDDALAIAEQVDV